MLTEYGVCGDTTEACAACGAEAGVECHWSCIGMAAHLDDEHGCDGTC